MPSIIDRIYEENEVLLNYLEERGQISLRSNVDNNFRKTLLLSAASYFESEIKESIVKFVTEFVSDENPILEFVKNKAIERQYHTYFSWKGRNANSFSVCLAVISKRIWQNRSKLHRN